MSYRLILLGLLAERPHYGYDLKQTIEQRSFADYVPLSGGGLYYHLRKLCAEGHIEEQTVEHTGNYPDRHIYHITPQGRTYFLQLLRTTLDDVAGRRHYDPLDAALAFGGLLPPAEVVTRLQRQIEQYRPQRLLLEALHEIQSAVPQYVDLYSQLIVEHAIHRLTASIRWLETAIARIQAADEQTPQRLLAATAARDQLARQAGLPPDTLATVAAPYETIFAERAARDYGAMRNAKIAYSHAVDEAWQAYETALRAGAADGAATQRAREVYEQRVAAAWQAYSATIQTTRQAAVAAFTDTAQAFERALAQAAGEVAQDPILPPKE